MKVTVASLLCEAVTVFVFKAARKKETKKNNKKKQFKLAATEHCTKSHYLDGALRKSCKGYCVEGNI